jgi:hypothetical protein
MNIRRGLARIAHDQAEHLTILAMLVQNGLGLHRVTRLVIFGIDIFTRFQKSDLTSVVFD